MKSRNLKKWEDQARRFFGDDFWEDILSVLPDNEPQQAEGTDSTSHPRQAARAVARTNLPPLPEPAVDVYKTEKHFLVLVDLPGLRNVEHIDVFMQSGQLVVSGTVARSFSQQQTLQAERFQGDFKRVIPLPEPVVEDGINARYVNGVLEIRLPRRPKSQQPKKRIRIQTDP